MWSNTNLNLIKFEIKLCDIILTHKFVLNLLGVKKTIHHNVDCDCQCDIKNRLKKMIF